MPRITRRTICFALALLCVQGAVTCRAAAPEVSASAYVLLDADSGRVLLAREESRELPIASTTKIMTALVALEHSRLSDEVTVKREHLKEGSSMYLAEGETLTMEALLYGLMLPSGNDAAECIADYCGGEGGRERFVGWMNEKAAELGMSHSAFANPSGLDAKGHYSCALDMARLMAYGMTIPDFARIVSVKTVTTGIRTMTNHNKLLASLDGCIGGKTGYTGAAGRTLVTCAERSGLRLVAVTLHDGSDWVDHTALYEYGFSTYRHVSAVRRDRVYAVSAVRGGVTAAVSLCAAADLSDALAEDETLTLRVDAPQTVDAPIRAGEKLGELIVLRDAREIARIDLLAKQGVRAAQPLPQSGISNRLRALFGIKE